METEVKNKTPEAVKTLGKKLGQYKYPLLILALGALLVLWPFGGSKKQEITVQPQTVQLPSVEEESYVERTEQRLSKILSGISGAGKVEVMLTVRGSDITYFQTDNESASEQADGSSRTSAQYKTVILSGSGEYDKPAVIKTEYPAFQGALIVCQGAEDAAVRLALVNAVSSLLGLGTDKISVVKMK